MIEHPYSEQIHPEQASSTNFVARLWQTLNRHRAPYLFLSPFFIFFAIFGLYPVAYSFYLSFHRWNGMGDPLFVGFDHFERMLNDRILLQSYENSFYLFFIYVPVMILLALVLAVVLNSPKIRGFRFYRTIIFTPFITNMIAAGFAFQILLNTNYGLVNSLLESVGLRGAPWLEDDWWARVSLGLLIIWAWLGYNMVLMLAGLQTISNDLNEAARVDGANRVQVFLLITVPLMRPIILFAMVMSTMGTFGLFAEVDALTGGGPAFATITPLIKIYGNAFDQFQFGYASAMAYVYFVFIFVLTMVQLRLFGRESS